MREMKEGTVFRCGGCGMAVEVTHEGDCTCLVCCGAEMAEESRREDRESQESRSEGSEPEDYSLGC
jgi:desulfoferrodoxin-like iron-binding protein